MYSKAQLYFLASYSGQVNYKDEAHQNGQGHGFSFRVKQRMMKTEITYSSLLCSLKESGSQFSKFVGIIGPFLFGTLSCTRQKSLFRKVFSIYCYEASLVFFFYCIRKERNQKIHNTVAVDEGSTVKNIVQTVQIRLQDTKILQEATSNPNISRFCDFWNFFKINFLSYLDGNNSGKPGNFRFLIYEIHHSYKKIKNS
jgi:hypothetical protein